MLSNAVRPLAPAFVVNMIEQVGMALDAAHHAGLIHRDVKPSNILITDQDFVYLIDFGLARTAGEAGMTTAGSTLGTLAYMAPERFESGTVDPRSDIYALTCVLYECLTGARPYPVDSPSSRSPGTWCRRRRSRRTPIRGWPLSTRSSPRAWRRSRPSGTRPVPSWLPRRAPRSTRRCAARVRPAFGPTCGPARGAVAEACARDRRGDGVGGRGVRRGVWQLRGSSGTESAPSLADSSSTTGPVEAPLGAVPEIAATVPPEIRDAGRLVIGVNVPYAPTSSRIRRARSSASTWI